MRRSRRCPLTARRWFSRPAVAQARSCCARCASIPAPVASVSTWTQTRSPKRAGEAGDLPARFEVRDAATIGGSFDAVINVASSHVHGGFPAALGVCRGLAPVVLYGEGFWQQRPSEEFLAALGGATVDELSDLAGLRAAIGEAGFDIVHESVAVEADWAHYEETLAANAERHGTPDTLAYARAIRQRRALPGGTDTLGFALFVLRA